jgi:predicted permease
MTWLRILANRLAGLFRKNKSDREMDEEFRFHLEMQIEENLQRGMSPEEARDAALRKFGGVVQAKEAYRDQRGLPFLETTWRDAVYGVRMLRKNPGFTAVAVMSVALGIGATTAIFSIIDTTFLHPLPYPEPDSLVQINEIRLDSPSPDYREYVSAPTFLDWKNQSRSFEEMAADATQLPVFNGRERSEQVFVRDISEGYFKMLKAHPHQGRLFIPDDFVPGTPDRTVLSYPAWQRLFGSNPSIIGSTIKVAGKLFQVIGVMSPEFRDFEDKVDLWIPYWVGERHLRRWRVVGRLKPGINIEKAQAEMDVIESRLAQQYPEQKDYGAQIQPLQVAMYDYYYKSQFLAFFGAVVLILLIACMNVANLLMARGTSREKEIAIRASLGAGRARLVRQLLTESLLLSLLGTALGLFFAYAAVRFAVYTSPQYVIPRADEISFNLHMLGFTGLIALLTSCMFGLFPALRASKPTLTESLKEGRNKTSASLAGRRIQNVLVIGQIALSLLLLVGAGLLIHNVWRALHISYGFKTDHLAQMSIRLARFECLESINPGSARLKPKAAMIIKRIEERLKALPGVRSVSVTRSGVFSKCSEHSLSTEGPPPQQYYGSYEQNACYEPVGPGYFGMLEIPLLMGRGFNNQDSNGSTSVAVISQKVARRFFPGQDPIGKMINIGNSENDEFERRQVVGVVGDVRWSSYWPKSSAVYYPYSQMPSVFAPVRGGGTRLNPTFLVRSEGNPATLVRLLDRVALEVDKDILIVKSETVESTRWRQSDELRFYTWLLVSFAGTALTLAAVGVFGVISYAVARRTHEMGIRIAVGARSRDVLRLILWNGILMTSIGLAIGLGGSLTLARFLENQLGELGAVDVKSTDPSTLAAVSLFLVLVALLASYIPARRAAKIEPMVALRDE